MVNVVSTDERPGPVRTCLGCGKKQPKRLLHRLVLDERRQPVKDTAQTAPGRGAYLCGPGCLKAAVKKKAFQRAFKQSIELVVNDLEEALRT
ncbi:MAG: YlxR family protein [Myxococcaceae bacterium]|nr:YlxR family protein [Myxococcaceae bacterium]